MRKLRELTDEEEAQIQRQIANDPDAPEATDEELAQAKTFAEAFPEMAEAIRRGRGRPRVDAPKKAVTLRLAPDTLAKFQAAGEDWRSKMSEVLDNAKV